MLFRALIVSLGYLWWQLGISILHIENWNVLVECEILALFLCEIVKCPYISKQVYFDELMLFI